MPRIVHQKFASKKGQFHQGPRDDAKTSGFVLPRMMLIQLFRMSAGAPLAKGTAACEANAPSGSVHHDGSPDELADGIDRSHLEAVSRQLTGGAPFPATHV
jgi:hypothetical protein